MKKIAKAVESFLPKGVGFCVLTFKMEKPETANYISNAVREDMIKSLFETAYRLKEKQDKVVN